MKPKDRKILFKVLQSCARLENIDYNIYQTARSTFENELYGNAPQYRNSLGDREAICTSGARHFGVTTRSMQRLYAKFYGPQRPTRRVTTKRVR